ncbi:MAG: insulinase family protein [Planctomycetes bacterium]|nr:insulinase family protein [Planctomycetota bacterium]
MSRFVLVLLAFGLPITLHGAEPAKVSSEETLFKTASSLFDGITTYTLPNGLTVYLKPIPGAPVVTTMMAYKVGACDEELDQTGLSHYLEHLLFKGTDKLFPGDIDRQTQRNGGRNNAYTSDDMTVYHFDFAADRWAIALDIEADRMRNTRIDAKHEFQQEKGAVISELNGNEDRPWDLENKAILPLLYGAKAPYGHPVIGERKHVEGATAEVIKRYYDRWYYPNNASLVVVGGFDEKEAKEKIEKLFAKIPKGELPDRKPALPVPDRKETVRHKMVSKFETPRLLMAFNTVASGHADEYALDVVTSAIAGGKTSRLYRKLVDDLKLASSVGASHTAGRYPGNLEINAELLKNDLEKVEGLIAVELKKLADEGITEAELKRVKRGISASYIFGNESVHSICDSIAKGVTVNSLEYLKGYLPKLAAVTNDDVKKAARKYLIDPKGVVVWSLPELGAKENGAAPAARDALAGRASRLLDEKSGASTFKLTDAKSVTLPNGLKLWLLENHRLPLVVVNASVRQTRLREPADKHGVSSLVSYLMEEGTTTRKGEEIARLIEDTGGSLSVSSSGGTLKVLTPDLEIGIDLLLDCMMNPTFAQDILEAKREDLLSTLAEEERKPESRASNAFESLIYGKHPYGRPSHGDAAIVKKLTRKDCQDFHASLFRPNNTTLAIVGDFDSAKLIELIKKQTANWKSVPMPPLAQVEIPMSKEFTQKIISDPEAAQLHVFLGHRGIKRDNPDYYKLLVMDNVLGTGPGFTDRLSANLRDRQGLAYTVSAQIAASAGEEYGTFTGYIGTFPDKYTWVRDGFLKEIRKIRDEPPTLQEVEDAKKYLTGSLPFRTITCDQIAGLLLSLDRFGLGLNYFDDYRKAVSSVTPEDVQAMAKKYLDPDRLILVAVGAIDADGKPLKKK